MGCIVIKFCYVDVLDFSGKIDGCYVQVRKVAFVNNAISGVFAKVFIYTLVNVRVGGKHIATPYEL